MVNEKQVMKETADMSVRPSNPLVDESAAVVKDLGKPIIKVLGVGGGGSNAVTRMYENRIPGVDYIAVNTDKQALDRATVPATLRIGDQTARGLGVGGDPGVGRACMDQDREQAREILAGADMVFVAAGMGGGTGTGAAPVVAEISRELGALTIGVVTKPFSFEGNKRQQQAITGIEELKKHVDTLIVIPNDRLLDLTDKNQPLADAFKLADNVLRQGVQAIAEVILVAGIINLDFNDLRKIMDKAGPAWMAIGRGSGTNRAVKAAQSAMNSPMLEVDIEGATGIIFNITGGSDLTLREVNEASEFIKESAHPDANIIFGTANDPSLRDEIKITIVATGFESNSNDMPRVGGYTQANDIMEQLEGDVKIPRFLYAHQSIQRKLKAQERRRQQQEAAQS